MGPLAVVIALLHSAVVLQVLYPVLSLAPEPEGGLLGATVTAGPLGEIVIGPGRGLGPDHLPTPPGPGRPLDLGVGLRIVAVR